MPVIKFTTVGLALEKKYRLDMLNESLINLDMMPHKNRPSNLELCQSMGFNPTI